jgi:hypothetical protein
VDTFQGATWVTLTEPQLSGLRQTMHKRSASLLHVLIWELPQYIVTLDRSRLQHAPGLAKRGLRNTSDTACNRQHLRCQTSCNLAFGQYLRAMRRA